MRILAVIVAGACVAACAYPVSSVVQGGVSSGIFVTSAPMASRLIIDGRDMGEATTFDGVKAVASVESGQHRVVIQGPAGALYDRTVYVGSGSRVSIKVN